MTATLQFRPLYGAESDDPFCFLLKIGSVTVLLDCGWNEQFDLQLLQPLLQAAPDVDLVLLSHPDTRHVGALPYLVAKGGLKAPVYAAAPVAKLGMMFMYDHHASRNEVSDFSLFGLEDIDKAFTNTVNLVKHHQPVKLVLQGTALRIVGYPAGHMLGGTVWVLEAGSEVVVYGVDTNHNKERHLNGGQLSNVPSRPALLITDCSRVHIKAMNRATREKALKDAILGVLRRQGSVLLPVDSAGRMLELLLTLEKMWATTEPRLPYPLALLSHVGGSTIDYARNMIEWMSDEVQREFNVSNTNPLQTQHFKNTIRLCHCPADVNRLCGPSPKVVLATGITLEAGLARQMLLQWGADPRNAVLFTQPPRGGTLAADLLSPRPPGPLSLSLLVGRRVPLQGAELEAFEAARLLAEAAAAAAGEEEAAAAAAVLPMRESSGVLSQLKRSNTGAVEQVLPEQHAAFDAFGSDSAMAEEGVLMDGFAPPAGAMYAMFPDEQELLQQEWDAYGAVVDTSGLRMTDEALEAGAAAAEEEDQDVEDVPTKVVHEQVSLSFAATAQLLEGYSGASDARSLRTIVANLAPRALVLIGGGMIETMEMANACKRELPPQQTRVYTPATGETVTLPLAPSYPVAISSTLLHGLSKHALTSGNITYDVAWLDGEFSARPSSTASAEDASAAGSSSTTAAQAAGCEPAFILLPPGTAAAAQDALQQQQQQHSGGGGGSLQGAGSLAAAAAAAANGEHFEAAAAADAVEGASAAAAAAAGGGGEAMDVDGSAALDDAAAAAVAAAAAAVGDHGGIFIGDVKLSEVKQALAAVGVPSEFRPGGRLVVGGSLVVRRDGPEGQLLMEGPLCEDYFKVRDVVYSQYNVC